MTPGNSVTDRTLLKSIIAIVCVVGFIGVSVNVLAVARIDSRVQSSNKKQSDDRAEIERLKAQVSALANALDKTNTAVEAVLDYKFGNNSEESKKLLQQISKELKEWRNQFPQPTSQAAK